MLITQIPIQVLFKNTLTFIKKDLTNKNVLRRLSTRIQNETLKELLLTTKKFYYLFSSNKTSSGPYNYSDNKLFNQFKLMYAKITPIIKRYSIHWTHFQSQWSQFDWNKLDSSMSNVIIKYGPLWSQFDHRMKSAETRTNSSVKVTLNALENIKVPRLQAGSSLLTNYMKMSSERKPSGQLTKVAQKEKAYISFLKRKGLSFTKVSNGVFQLKSNSGSYRLNVDKVFSQYLKEYNLVRKYLHTLIMTNSSYQIITAQDEWITLSKFMVSVLRRKFPYILNYMGRIRMAQDFVFECYSETDSNLVEKKIYLRSFEIEFEEVIEYFLMHIFDGTVSGHQIIFTDWDRNRVHLHLDSHLFVFFKQWIGICSQWSSQWMSSHVSSYGSGHYFSSWEESISLPRTSFTTVTTFKPTNGYSITMPHLDFSGLNHLRNLSSFYTPHRQVRYRRTRSIHYTDEGFGIPVTTTHHTQTQNNFFGKVVKRKINGSQVETEVIHPRKNRYHKRKNSSYKRHRRANAGIHYHTHETNPVSTTNDFYGPFNVVSVSGRCQNRAF
jgi:hypothetical protein